MRGFRCRLFRPNLHECDNHRMTECKCELAGFCKRHNVHKTEHWRNLCQTNERYFQAWENGTGPAQPIPPEITRKRREARLNKIKDGPGDFLHKYLSTIGIREAPGCSCASHRTQMNQWGPDKCEKHIDKIVSWMEEEAKKRSLPFIRIAAKQLVKWAISKSRRARAATS